MNKRYKRVKLAIKITSYLSVFAVFFLTGFTLLQWELYALLVAMIVFGVTSRTLENLNSGEAYL